jgi:hypothetical protein
MEQSSVLYAPSWLRVQVLLTTALQRHVSWLGAQVTMFGMEADIR